MKNEVLRIEEELRTNIEKVLVHVGYEADELRNGLNTMPLGNLIYELEKFWSFLTTVKSYQSYLNSALNGCKILIVVSNEKSISLGDLEAFQWLGFIPAVVETFEQVQTMSGYFIAAGVLGGIVTHVEDKYMARYVRIKALSPPEPAKMFTEIIIHGRARIHTTQHED